MSTASIASETTTMAEPKLKNEPKKDESTDRWFGWENYNDFTKDDVNRVIKPLKNSETIMDRAIDKYGEEVIKEHQHIASKILDALLDQ